jgi:signal transduction histidine kinase
LLPLLVAVAAAAGLLVVPADSRPAAALYGAAATLAVAALAGETARRGRALAALRARGATEQAELADLLVLQEQETLRLARDLLPALVARVQLGEFAEDVLRDTEDLGAGLSPGFRTAYRTVMRTVVDAVHDEEALRDAAQRAFVNIARRVQAIVHTQASDLRDMEDKHGTNPAVFGDLLRLDHGNALIGRLADSIAVLGGARPGRQWRRAVPLYSVLRGAMSRILDYQRVELHSVSEIAVVGPTVEPLIHAVAELLDNATRYSPPQTRVHLTAVEVQAGIAIEIEDGGVSLSEEGRLRAERMLEEARAGIDLNDLGETPRLGLAVVGRLARANNFQVALRPSAYGGVRAVLIVPSDALTTAPATGIAHGIGAVGGPRAEGRRRLAPRPHLGGPRPSPTAPVPPARTAPPAHPGQPPRPAAQPPSAAGAPAGARVRAPEPPDEDEPVVTEWTPGGLPQRRRRMPTTTEPITVNRAAPQPPAQDGPGSRFGQYGQNGQRPRDHQAPEGHTPPGAAQPEPSQTQPGLWLAAFHQGVNGVPAADETGTGTAPGHPGGSSPAHQHTGEAGRPSDRGE